MSDPKLGSESAAVNYVLAYGGRCRDCADNVGTCPVSWLPCEGREKAVRFVVEALTYGIRNGFIEPFDGSTTFVDADELNALRADVKRLMETGIDLAAHLAAAISLLEHGGKAARKAAPSDKMFDQMIRDYKRSLNKARAALTQTKDTTDDA